MNIFRNEILRWSGWWRTEVFKDMCPTRSDEPWRTHCPYYAPDFDENLLEVPLKNLVPNPADESSSCHGTPLQEEIPTPQSEELNNNLVPISSPSLAAPVKKRGRKKDSAEVRALRAQIRIEETRKVAEKIKELKKWWGGETKSEGTWRLSCIVKIMQWFWKMCIYVKCHKWFFMFHNMLQRW